MSHDTADHMHLPHGSWWPFWLACAMALLVVGMLLFGNALQASEVMALDESGALVHERYDWGSIGLGYLPLAIGLAAVVGSLAGWFKEDFRWWANRIGTGTHIPKAGTLLFIASEVFIFGALFSNYFTFQGLNAGHWPDTHEPLGLFTSHGMLVTGFFTLCLFGSSATLHVAEKNLKQGNHKAFVRWWGFTILLGLVFLGGQVSEYVSLIQEGHGLGSSQFMSAFFILTGTHGLHVFGGLCALFVIWLRARAGQFDKERHAGPQVIGMYWHFVDLVWVFVFGVVYVLNAI